ncbi:hypothetical protein BO71DRAFT_31917 [Aspergillus ellipticus CBS 707.79]|uniref:Uncharacterized protein n=1 Tax=Aspergillus ellipticus CBS 707.79 TaxID=1448320 RepID=A0A319D4Q5_9EURO|nr:hypothetical protein BO71DRAFT_31917 [Aspergillus ellipticus CBS 707.79]
MIADGKGNRWVIDGQSTAKWRESDSNRLASPGDAGRSSIKVIKGVLGRPGGTTARNGARREGGTTSCTYSEVWAGKPTDLLEGLERHPPLGALPTQAYQMARADALLLGKRQAARCHGPPSVSAPGDARTLPLLPTAPCTECTHYEQRHHPSTRLRPPPPRSPCRHRGPVCPNGSKRELGPAMEYGLLPYLRGLWARRQTRRLPIDPCPHLQPNSHIHCESATDGVSSHPQ